VNERYSFQGEGDKACQVLMERLADLIPGNLRIESPHDCAVRFIFPDGSHLELMAMHDYDYQPCLELWVSE